MVYMVYKENYEVFYTCKKQKLNEKEMQEIYNEINILLINLQKHKITKYDFIKIIIDLFYNLNAKKYENK